MPNDTYYIEAGTLCRIKRQDLEWTSVNFKHYRTRKRQAFTRENVSLDPILQIGNGDGSEIAKSYAANGYYVFNASGFDLLVHGSKVGRA